MSELSMAVAKARAARRGDFLATPQALIEERARHERALIELRTQWESEKQVYEERLQSLSNELAIQRSIMEKMLEHRASLRGIDKLSPRFETIRNAVCEHFGVYLVDFCSSRRAYKLSIVRQVAYWLARELTTLSTTQIGRICGGRDHTTIIHGVERVKDHMDRDPVWAAEILALKEKIEASIRDNAETARAAERQQDAQS